MAREFLWVTRSGQGTGIDEGARVSVELTSTVSPTAATVTRCLLWVTIAGTLDVSPQFVAVGLAGISVGGTPPANPFSATNLQALDWLGLAQQGLDAPAETTASVKRTRAASWEPTFDVRAQRVIDVGEDVWLSLGVDGQILSGTWQYRYLARLLLLLPAA